MKIGKILLTTIAMFLFVFTTNAQVTTASINGKITSNGGESVIGATIVATHIPSGTTYGAVTNDKGRYSIQGMRVGGPYKIVISYVGYTKVVYDNVQLSLGESSTYNADLKESSKQLGEIVVSASSVQNAAGGAASNFKQTQITNTPTVDRNIYDVVKLSPLVAETKLGGISIAGSNNRYNSFQIDGTVSNDVFGLAGTGTNGGQTGANPISLDAIQAIQVVASPFDVRQSGFTGGAINVITKSGTNKLHGSAYGYYNNQDMYGTWSQPLNKKSKLDNQSTSTAGFTIGGPIIKDKLFYFASAEYKYNNYPSLYYPGYTSDYVSKTDAQKILDQYESITGLTDNYNPRNVETTGLSALARIDWNINKDNKFSFRYQLNNSSKYNYSSGSYYYYFANSGYNIQDVTNSFVAELNSTINSTTHNEARVSAVYVRDNRSSPNNGPTVIIKQLGAKTNITAYIGSEQYSTANALNQDIYTLEDNLSWYLGDHTLTVGTHEEMYNIWNLFISNSNGTWQFNTLDDFLNDNPSRFYYNYSDVSVTGTDKWGATVQAAQLGFYAQDKWNVSNNFNLTYGIRADIPFMLNTPSTNAAFNSSIYATTYGVKVGTVPSPKLMLSPRAGFRWYTDDTHNTLLRGGLGLFTGRVPFVWMSNIYGNTGIEMKGATVYSGAPSFDKYAKDPYAGMVAAGYNGSNSPTINTAAKDFRFPQVFRGDLALEQKLPGNVKFSLEGLFSKTMNNVFFQNLALTNNGKKVYAVSADDANSAAPYYSHDTGSYYAIINLKNTNKGYSYSLSAQLEKNFDFGLDLMAAYTFGHSYAVNDGTSSIAYSNWKYNYSIDPNNENEVSFSKFDIPNRITAQVTYTTPKYANNRLSTVASLTYSGFNGMRYSLTMDEYSDFNGDGYYGNSLLYIPTKTELAKMTFVSATDQSSFENWIENDSYAKNHRGQYAERNSNSAPWENHFNLHLAEDFYYLKGQSNKVSLTFDIINFSNLLNKEWGSVYSSYYNVDVLKVTKMTADTNGNMIPTYSYDGQEVTKSDFLSRWNMQIGLRITF